MRYLASWCCLVLASGSLAGAQEKTTERSTEQTTEKTGRQDQPEAVVRQQIAAGRRSMAAVQQEQAAVHFRRAWAMLQDRQVTGSARRELLAEVAPVLKELDPRGIDLERARDRHAQRLRLFAEGYLRRGWRDTATALARQVQALQPVQLSTELRGLLVAPDTPGPKPKAATDSALRAWFQDLDYNPSREAWKFDGETLVSPTMKGGPEYNGDTLYSTRLLKGDAILEFECRIPKTGGFGFGVGHHHEQERSVMFVAFQNGYVKLVEFVLPNQTRLNEHFMEVDLTERWIRGELMIRGKTIHARVEGMREPLSATVKTTLDGGLCLWVSTTKDGKDVAARFRNLRVLEL